MVLVWQTVEFYPEIGIIQEKIKNQEALVKDSEDILQRAKEFKNFVSKNQELADKFNIILPVNEDKENLISDLAGLASVNGLSLLKISFEEKSKSENIQAVKENKQSNNDLIPRIIKLSLRGSYPSFKNLLAMIEKNLRIMDVVAIDFSGSSSKEEDEKGLYLYNVEIKTYSSNPIEEENIIQVLNNAKYKNFEIKSLNFAEEKSFKELTLSPNYNIDINESEIGNQNIF